MAIAAQTSTSHSLIPPISNVDAYIKYVREVPNLEHEEEIRLMSEYSKTKKVESVQAVILSYLKLSVNLAIKLAGVPYFKMHRMDLIQCGNIGLLEAMKRYDVTLGHRFSSLASIYIRNEICEYIVQNFNCLSGHNKTKPGRKLMFNYTNVQKVISENGGVVNDDVIQKIQDEFNVHRQAVIDALGQYNFKSRSLAADGSLESRYGMTGDASYDEGFTIDIAADNDLLEYYVEEEYRDHQNDALYECMDEVLNDREIDILMARRMYEKPAKLRELSEKHNISNERVRQIETIAVKKLKEHIKQNHKELLCA